MKREQIAEALKELQFELATKGRNEKGGGASGYRHRNLIERPGAIYVHDDRLSATGLYANLQDLARPTSRDNHNYPVWAGADVTVALNALAKHLPTLLRSSVSL